MYVDILILASLWSGSRHGYEIRHSAGAMLGGSCLLNNNQLYPLLRRFEAEGVVTSTTLAQVGRPERHVYSLTSQGKSLLKSRIAEFPEAMARDDREFLIRVHHFHLIEARARCRILEARLAALHERLERTAARLEAPETKKRPYVQQASEFVTAKTRLEMDWIAGLLGSGSRKASAKPLGAGK
ncbi:MAG: hypothetical protein B9S32_16645 [Verrucomicrobia bacterium Tous-C9LFEB]|nr:MAG: hypothetical protein B9S32_16645 [Verrucomicrobia bacterium Tous-C9LFEB]